MTQHGSGKLSAAKVSVPVRATERVLAPTVGVVGVFPGPEESTRLRRARKTAAESVSLPGPLTGEIADKDFVARLIAKDLARKERQAAYMRVYRAKKRGAK